MLVLDRGVEQRILIGDDVEVVVVAIHANYVRLGIVCPNETVVYRAELSEEHKERIREGRKA